MDSILEARSSIEQQRATGMLGAGRRLVAAVWEHAEVRLELFTLELAEERSRIVKAAIAAGSLLFFGVLASTFIGIAVLVAAWDTDYRLAVAVAVAIVFAAAGFVAWMTLRRLISRETPLFRHSLAEWRKDVHAIRSASGGQQ